MNGRPETLNREEKGGGVSLRLERIMQGQSLSKKDRIPPQGGRPGVGGAGKDPVTEERVTL